MEVGRGSSWFATHTRKVKKKKLGKQMRWTKHCRRTASSRPLPRSQQQCMNETKVKYYTVLGGEIVGKTRKHIGNRHNTTKPPSPGEERQQSISQVFSKGRNLLDFRKLTLAQADWSRTSYQLSDHYNQVRDNAIRFQRLRWYKSQDFRARLTKGLMGRH